MAFNVLLGRPFVLCDLILTAVCVPMILGWIPRNRFYGVRTRKTLSNDAVWYPANRVGGALLVGAALVSLLILMLLPFSDLQTEHFQLAAFLGPLAIATVWTLLYVRKL